MSERALIGRVGALLCAVPLTHVVETMRPLSVAPFGGEIPWILGLAIIRGAPTVVIDTARMLGAHASSTTRYVVVRAGERTLALTFDEVVGIRPIVGFANLPPLARETAPDAIATIGTSDASLLVLLETTRVLSDDVWARVEEGLPP